VEEDVLARIARALDELSPDGRAMKELAFLAYTDRTARPALARQGAGKPELSEAERANWQDLLDRLSPVTSRESRIELLSRLAIEVAGVMVRVRTAGRPGGDTITPPDLERTAMLLVEADKELSGPPSEADPAIVVTGRQALELYRSLSSPNGPPPELSAAQGLYLYGWAHGPAVHQRLARSVREVQRAVLRGINFGGSQTDCLMREAAANLPIFSTRIDELSIEDIRSAVDAARSTSRLTQRFVRDQVCMAILPPCSPCDDTAVLLACVKVVGCKVVEICNLERRFVLSPTAVRHWLPPLGWLGAIVEEACCAGEDLADAADAARRQIEKRVAALAMMVESPGVGSFARVAGRFYAGAPRPGALAGAMSPLLAMAGGRAPAAAARPPAPASEVMVTRAELDEIVAGLKKEIARVQAHPPPGGKPGKGGGGGRSGPKNDEAE
jgi:hypothetical protein